MKRRIVMVLAAVSLAAFGASAWAHNTQLGTVTFVFRGATYTITSTYNDETNSVTTVTYKGDAVIKTVTCSLTTGKCS